MPRMLCDGSTFTEEKTLDSTWSLFLWIPGRSQRMGAPFFFWTSVEDASAAVLAHLFEILGNFSRCLHQTFMFPGWIRISVKLHKKPEPLI